MDIEIYDRQAMPTDDENKANLIRLVAEFKIDFENDTGRGGVYDMLYELVELATSVFQATDPAAYEKARSAELEEFNKWNEE